MRLCAREFLGLRLDFGDGLLAAFGGIFIGKDDVYEHGTRHHGVHVLAKHLRLFTVTDAEAVRCLNSEKNVFKTQKIKGKCLQIRFF